jgi:hypothetical protein
MERVAVIGLPLASVMGFGRKDELRAQPKEAFGEQLQAVMAVDERQKTDVATESRQPDSAASSQDWLPPIAATNSGSVLQLENPIPKVQDLLVKMGINPAEMQFELLDDVNSNPLGAGHINHLMRVKTSNGWKNDFAVEYILRNPSITANEIAAMKRLPTAPDHLRWV